MHKILIIQPAFLGDAILATALLEKLQQYYPGSEIDFLIRKGNERIFAGHPSIRKLLLLDKKKKWSSLWQLLGQIRQERYNLVVNVHRHFSAGLLTIFSGAIRSVGFRQNPLSIFFSKRFQHRWDLHETARNQALIAHLTDTEPALPKLYPSKEDYQYIQTEFKAPYITISPASLWATKQLPISRWAAFLDKLNPELPVYLLGGPSDQALCTELKAATKHPLVSVLAGQQSFGQDIALMEGALMNYVNDSAPLHICSAVNAPVAAIFCSTAPHFGFGPLSDKSFILRTEQELDCWPCGKHGHQQCPKGHFKCSELGAEQLLGILGE